MKRAFLFPIALLAVTATAQNPNRLHQLKSLKVATITAGRTSLKVWIMDDPSKRQEGMMFLSAREVPSGHGMLFVFPSPQQLSFWMKNTPLALDLAYIDANGRVISVHAMKPHELEGVPSKKPAKYVLEMPRGAFAKFKIRPGMVFKIPATIRARS